MTAETLNCPMCGASASSEATCCEHCGARLATVACPSCFGMNFQGAKYCSHCGARVDRAEVPGAAPQRCPRCRVGMEAVAIGTSMLRECPRCQGIWAGTESLQQICADREQQGAVLGMAAPVPANQAVVIEENIRYVPCPVCQQLMNRINFAKCSHIVVDVCNQHGTWFDKDELRGIVEFIRGGGLEKARFKEKAELEAQKRALQAGLTGGVWGTGDRPQRSDHLDWGEGLSAAASVLARLLR